MPLPVDYIVVTKTEYDIIQMPDGFEKEVRNKWLAMVHLIVSEMNKKSISVKELSRQTKISKNRLERILSSYFDFDLRTISKLSAALGVELITFPDYKYSHTKI